MGSRAYEGGCKGYKAGLSDPHKHSADHKNPESCTLTSLARMSGVIILSVIGCVLIESQGCRARSRIVSELPKKGLKKQCTAGQYGSWM